LVLFVMNLFGVRPDGQTMPPIHATEHQKRWFATVRANLEAVEGIAAGVDGVVPTQRKGYSARSLSGQFAALRPLKGGRALLCLKLEPEASVRLGAAVRKQSWSERQTALVELDDAAAVDGEIARVFAVAAERG
jgi:hypothetical protein